MFEKIPYKIVQVLKKKDASITGDKEEVILFGITRIVEDIPKFFSLFLICYLLGIFKELLIVFLLNMLYKPFIGGAHARTNKSCFFLTISYFLVLIYMCKLLVFSKEVTFVIQVFLFLFGNYIIFKYVPADSQEIPIINKTQRKTLKAIAFSIFFVMNIVMLGMLYKNIDTEYINYIMYTTFLTNLMTIKPVYKILGSKYGFLEYKKEGKI